MSQELKKAVPTVARTGPDAVATTVSSVIADIRRRGDEAVREYSARFDNWSPADFRLTHGDRAHRRHRAAADHRRHPDRAGQRARFAERQLASMQEFEVETEPGVFLGQRHNPVDAVGAYVPGGRYPLLASAHMTVLTAKVAGVGGLWTTASDLVRFGQHWTSLLTPDQVRESLRTQVKQNAMEMGLGWLLNPAKDLYGHAGAGPGAGVSLLVRPSTGTVTVAATNRLVPIEPTNARLSRRLG